MCLFRKNKSKNDIILKNKETIGRNAADAAIILSQIKEDFKEIHQMFSTIYDELKYFSPSTSQDIHKIDQQIHQYLDDLKIDVLRLQKDGHQEPIINLLERLKTQIVSRNEESKRFKI